TCSPAPARGANRQIDESRLLTDQDEGLFTNSAYTRRRLISDILRPLFQSRATLASRSCAGSQGSSPKAAPSGTSSAGGGRSPGAVGRLRAVPCRPPAAPPRAR